MGYTDAFIPEIWDAAVYRTLQDNLIAKQICRNYSDKVKKAGDTIHFNGLADPSVSAYSGTVSYENLNASQISLLIDQQNYYAFDVPDIDQSMANVDLKGSQTERAAYVLKKSCDTYIMGLYGLTIISIHIYWYARSNTATPLRIYSRRSYEKMV